MRTALTRALPAACLPPQRGRQALRLAQAGVNCLSSMRFARGLLITIGLVALLGTIIPQQEELPQYLARFGPVGSQVVTRLGLTDLYHSWYFVGLLVLLGAGLMVCSIRRWSVSLRTLGSIVTHLSFVLIIVGGFIRHVAGVEGVVELREGEQTNQLKITETRTHALPFTIHLEDFYFKRYAENPGTVSEFTSQIRLSDDERTSTDAAIRVNHPIAHRGFCIYQLGYNLDDPTWSALLLVKDPGVPVVYTGFGLLMVGLITTLYLAPWQATRSTR